MSRQNRKFARELRNAGATEQEIAELTRAAERLGAIRVPGLSDAARQRIASRLPVDIEPAQRSRRMPVISLRWSAAAVGFAAIAIVATAVLLPGTQQSSDNDAQQAHEVSEPKKQTEQEQLKQQLDKHTEELKQLEKQPTADPKELERAKERVRRDHKRYEQSQKRDWNKNQKQQLPSRNDKSYQRNDRSSDNKHRRDEPRSHWR